MPHKLSRRVRFANGTRNGQDSRTYEPSDLAEWLEEHERRDPQTPKNWSWGKVAQIIDEEYQGGLTLPVTFSERGDSTR